MLQNAMSLTIREVKWWSQVVGALSKILAQVCVWHLHSFLIKQMSPNWETFGMTVNGCHYNFCGWYHLPLKFKWLSWPLSMHLQIYFPGADKTFYNTLTLFPRKGVCIGHKCIDISIQFSVVYYMPHLYCVLLHNSHQRYQTQRWGVKISRAQ